MNCLTERKFCLCQLLFVRSVITFNVFVVWFEDVVVVVSSRSDHVRWWVGGVYLRSVFVEDLTYPINVLLGQKVVVRRCVDWWAGTVCWWSQRWLGWIRRLLGAWWVVGWRHNWRHSVWVIIEGGMPRLSWRVFCVPHRIRHPVTVTLASSLHHPGALQRMNEERCVGPGLVRRLDSGRAVGAGCTTCRTSVVSAAGRAAKTRTRGPLATTACLRKTGTSTASSRGTGSITTSILWSEHLNIRIIQIIWEE